MGIETSIRNYRKRVRLVTGNDELTFADNQNVINVFSDVDVTINVPGNLGKGFHCHIAQKGAGKAILVGTDGAVIINVNGIYETSGIGSLIEIIATDDFQFSVTDNSGSGGGGGTVPVPWELFPAPGSNITVSGFLIAVVIRLKNPGTGLNFKIGTTPGGNELYDDDIVIGENTVCNLMYYSGGSDIYLTTEFDCEVKIYNIA